MSGFWYLANKIVVSNFIVMTAIGAVSIQTITDQAVFGLQYIEYLHIRGIAFALESHGAEDLELFRPVRFSVWRGKSFRGPAKFIIHIPLSEPFKRFGG